MENMLKAVVNRILDPMQDDRCQRRKAKKRFPCSPSFSWPTGMPQTRNTFQIYPVPARGQPITKTNFSLISLVFPQVAQALIIIKRCFP